MFLLFVPAWMVMFTTALRVLRTLAGLLLELVMIVLWVGWMTLRLVYSVGHGQLDAGRLRRKERKQDPFAKTRRTIRDLPEI